MSTEPKTPEPTAPENVTETGSPEPRQPSTAEAVPKHHDDLIGELRREIADLKDRVLRAHADVENIRKRTEREKEETAKYAITKFARDVLTVGDNFQRALGAVPAGAADSDPALKSLAEGVSLIEREFLNALERHGVKRVAPENEPFNPHFHQAVMELPRPDVPSGTVVQVFQSGYTIEGRVLRPAMVVVATGGPKPGSQPSQFAASPSGMSSDNTDGQTSAEGSSSEAGADAANGKPQA